MGLMYWQINDIWQAPTWSTIEYGLIWKMAHYYVQQMYSLVYPLMILRPYLAESTDTNAQVSLYMINELSGSIPGQLVCSIHSLDTFVTRLSLSYEIWLNDETILHVADVPYASLMNETGCLNSGSCLLRCTYSNTFGQLDQTLFFTRPKHYRLFQPDLKIVNVEQISTNDVRLLLQATRPALFVWLQASSKHSGYFSQNGFHLFEPTMTVIFHSWAAFGDDKFDFRVKSLFDVTQE
jgi:beta-mannosidase